MTKLPPRTLNNPKKGIREIWTQHPEWQNTFSSSWWFFLFLPKQKTGYGPKQMMFAFASRYGDMVAFEDKWAPGIDPARELGTTEKFMTTISGWIHDGTQVHDKILLTTTEATLSYDDQYLEAWDHTSSDGKIGARIERSKNSEHEFALDGEFKGQRGGAKFTIWGSGDHYLHNLQIKTINRKRTFGLGVQYVPWRRTAFKGEFTSPSGTETLEGLGYFQRVLMNIPMLPWSWVYVLFEDGSIYSSFTINFGPHNFNRSREHRNQFLERLKYHVKPRGFFFDATRQEAFHFDSCTTIPAFNTNTSENEHPDFYVEGRMADGDFIRLHLVAHGHSQFTMDRRLIRNLWESKYTYNEYMVKVKRMNGKFNGQTISKKTRGQGWGNVEYTHGMSL